MSRSRKVSLLVVGICIVVGGLFLPRVPATAKKSPSTVSMSRARQLASGCKIYAIDHGGRLPSQLRDLEPDYVPNLTALRCINVQHETDSKIEVDWLYFGNGFEENRPPAVLIASPNTVTIRNFLSWRQYRLVVFGDATARLVKESEYQQLVAESSKRGGLLQNPVTGRP